MYPLTQKIVTNMLKVTQSMGSEWVSTARIKT